MRNGDEDISKKTSCDNTDNTDGFKIHHSQNGTFIATKGKTKLTAKTAEEINELIKKYSQEHK